MSNKSLRLLVLNMPIILRGELVEAVDARKVWEFLGVKTRFNDWIRRRIDDGGFEENVDYVLKNEYNQINGLRVLIQSNYYISARMAHHLGMMEKTVKGREIRDYYYELEKRLESIPTIHDPTLGFSIMAPQRRAIMKRVRNYTINTLPWRDCNHKRFLTNRVYLVLFDTTSGVIRRYYGIELTSALTRDYLHVWQQSKIETVERLVVSHFNSDSLLGTDEIDRIFIEVAKGVKTVAEANGHPLHTYFPNDLPRVRHTDGIVDEPYQEWVPVTINGIREIAAPYSLQ